MNDDHQNEESEKELRNVWYLSGFVWIFHSGGLLYVDFCRVHTSRLQEEEQFQSEEKMDPFYWQIFPKYSQTNIAYF